MTIQRSPAFLALLLMLGLSGCALFGDKSENSPVKLREALEVPPDLARPASDDQATVPSSGVAAYSDYTTKTPATPAGNASPASTNGKPAEPASGSVRLERDGAQRWLVVHDNAGPVWVKAREYFLRNKIPLTLDNPQAGLLETDWIDRPVKFTGIFSKFMAALQSTGLRDKFRVRVEPGREPGTAELYVSHQGLEEVVVSQNSANVVRTAWQPRPTDPEMEAEMLGKLLVHFGLDDKQAQGQVAATQPVGQVAATDGNRAQLIKGELILSGDNLDVAWRRVGQALDRAGVTTEDRDRSAGIFYVRYVDSSQPDKQQGMFSWLFSEHGNASVTPDGKKEVPSDRFQIRLKTTSAGTSVNVFDVKGEPEKSTTGEKLLGVLQQQLR